MAAVLMADRLVVCEAGALTEPDLATLDALARFALTARRQGRGVCLRHASMALRDLLALAGLEELLPCEALAIEPRR